MVSRRDLVKTTVIITLIYIVQAALQVTLYIDIW
jgi:hypothetical protein